MAQKGRHHTPQSSAGGQGPGSISLHKTNSWKFNWRHSSSHPLRCAGSARRAAGGTAVPQNSPRAVSSHCHPPTCPSSATPTPKTSLISVRHHQSATSSSRPSPGLFCSRGRSTNKQAPGLRHQPPTLRAQAIHWSSTTLRNY